MADKKSKLKSTGKDFEDDMPLGDDMDDFNFDDFDDLNFDASPDARTGLSKRRQLIGNAIKEVGLGGLRGIRDALRDAYPNTASVIDEGFAWLNDYRDMASETVDKLRDVGRQTGALAAKGLPLIKQLLPEKLYGKAETWLSQYKEDEEGEESEEARDRRLQQETIGNTITEVFDKQMAQDKLIAATERIERASDRNRDAKQFQISTKLLSSIDQKSAYVAKFIGGPYTAYLRKHLELTYQHYFVARDTFTVLKVYTRMMEAKMEELKHNSSLPDALKADAYRDEINMKRRSERTSAGSILTSFRDVFFRNAKAQRDETFDMVSSMLPMLDMLVGMGSTAADFGDTLTWSKLFTKGLGWGTKKLVSAGLNKAFDGRQNGFGVGAMENRMGSFVQSLYGLLGSQREAWESSDSPILNFLSKFIPQAEDSTRIEKTDLIADAQKAASFDVATRSAIVEVIPSHLARIGDHMEALQRGLTPSTVVPHKVFDPYTRRLVDREDFAANTLVRDLYGSPEQREDASREALFSLKKSIAQNIGKSIEQLSDSDFESFDANDVTEALQNVFTNLCSDTNLGTVLPYEFLKYYLSAQKNSDFNAEYSSVYIDRALAGIQGDQLKFQVVKELVRAFFRYNDAEPAKSVVNFDAVKHLEDLLHKRIEARSDTSALASNLYALGLGGLLSQTGLTKSGQLNRTLARQMESLYRADVDQTNGHIDYAGNSTFRYMSESRDRTYDYQREALSRQDMAGKDTLGRWVYGFIGGKYDPRNFIDRSPESESGRSSIIQAADTFATSQKNKYADKFYYVHRYRRLTPTSVRIWYAKFEKNADGNGLNIHSLASAEFDKIINFSSDIANSTTDPKLSSQQIRELNSYLRNISVDGVEGTRIRFDESIITPEVLELPPSFAQYVEDTEINVLEHFRNQRRMNRTSEGAMDVHSDDQATIFAGMSSIGQAIRNAVVTTIPDYLKNIVTLMRGQTANPVVNEETATPENNTEESRKRDANGFAPNEKLIADPDATIASNPLHIKARFRMLRSGAMRLLGKVYNPKGKADTNNAGMDDTVIRARVAQLLPDGSTIPEDIDEAVKMALSFADSTKGVLDIPDNKEAYSILKNYQSWKLSHTTDEKKEGLFERVKRVYREGQNIPPDSDLGKKLTEEAARRISGTNTDTSVPSLVKSSDIHTDFITFGNAALTLLNSIANNALFIGLKTGSMPVEAIKAVFNGTWGAVKYLGKGAFKLSGKALGTGLDYTKKALGFAKDFTIGAWKNTLPFITGGAGALWKGVKGIGKGAWALGKGATELSWDALKLGGKSARRVLGSAATTLSDATAGVAGGLNGEEVIEMDGKFYRAVGDDVVEISRTEYEAMRLAGAARRTVGSALSMTGKGLRTAGRWVRDGWNKATDFLFGGIKRRLESWGNMFKSYTDKLLGKADYSIKFEGDPESNFHRDFRLFANAMLGHVGNLSQSILLKMAKLLLVGPAAVLVGAGGGALNLAMKTVKGIAGMPLKLVNWITGRKFGDTDGDGDVEGSAEDLKQKQEEHRAKVNAKNAERDEQLRKIAERDKQKAQANADKEKKAEEGALGSWGGLGKALMNSKLGKSLIPSMLAKAGLRGVLHQQLKKHGMRGAAKALGKAGWWGLTKHGASSALGGLAGLFGHGAATAGATAAAGAGSAAGAAGATGATGAGAAAGGVALGPIAAITAGLLAAYNGARNATDDRTRENLGLDDDQQVTFGRRTASILGSALTLGLGRKWASKGLYKAGDWIGEKSGLADIARAFQGNDAYMKPEEIKSCYEKLKRAVDRGETGAQRRLEKFEEAIRKEEWGLARALAGREADGFFKQLGEGASKLNIVGNLGTKFGKWAIGGLIGNNEKPMDPTELRQARARLQHAVEQNKPGAQKIMDTFEEAVAGEKWEKARKLVEMDNKGLLQKMFGEMTAKKAMLLGAGAFGGLLFIANEDKPMKPVEIRKFQAQMEPLAAKNETARKALDRFTQYVEEGRWKQAREIANLPARSFAMATASALNNTIGAFFYPVQSKPMKPKEIQDFRDHMQYLIEKGDTVAQARLDKFELAIARNQWDVARKISKTKHVSTLGRVGIAYFNWVSGNDDQPLSSTEIEKFQESMRRKIDMGSEVAKKQLEAFEDAVGRRNWPRAREIAGLKLPPGSDRVNNYFKDLTRRAILATIGIGNQDSAMTPAEIEQFTEKMQERIDKGDEGAKAILERFQDYVADGKWRHARELSGIAAKGWAQKAGASMTKGLKGLMYGLGKDAEKDEKWTDDGSMSKRWRLIYTRVQDALHKKGIAPFERSTLAALRNDMQSVDPIWLDDEKLDNFENRLRAIDRSAGDLSSEAADEYDRLRKEKQPLVHQQEVLLSAINKAREETNVFSFRKQNRLKALYNEVSNLSVEELDKGYLDDLDTTLHEIHTSAERTRELSPEERKHYNEMTRRQQKFLVNAEAALDATGYAHYLKRRQISKLISEVETADMSITEASDFDAWDDLMKELAPKGFSSKVQNVEQAKAIRTFASKRNLLLRSLEASQKKAGWMSKAYRELGKLRSEIEAVADEDLTDDLLTAWEADLKDLDPAASTVVQMQQASDDNVKAVKDKSKLRREIKTTLIKVRKDKPTVKALTKLMDELDAMPDDETTTKGMKAFQVKFNDLVKAPSKPADVNVSGKTYQSMGAVDATDTRYRYESTATLHSDSPDAQASRSRSLVDRAVSIARKYGQKQELAISLDKNGHIVDSSMGDAYESTVKTTPGGSIVHSHPDGSPVSQTDIEAARAAGQTSVTAVNSNMTGAVLHKDIIRMLDQDKVYQAQHLELVSEISRDLKILIGVMANNQRLTSDQIVNSAMAAYKASKVESVNYTNAKLAPVQPKAAPVGPAVTVSKQGYRPQL